MKNKLMSNKIEVINKMLKHFSDDGKVVLRGKIIVKFPANSSLRFVAKQLNIRTDSKYIYLIIKSEDDFDKVIVQLRYLYEKLGEIVEDFPV